jgi:hypothetical protein
MKGQSYDDAESRARTQNKVLVIMDYQIFRKQVYRGTGCQRDSIEGVMDSLQWGQPNFSFQVLLSPQEAGKPDS